ncbi:MAG: hypothetical protein A2Y07_01590 [Planctomycetes bacterium GWF2_50_10]|nr:MAG: hypothetical protein A2Y07_01590 [Planctomycetes bacterium GWF2_50_10]
MAKAVFLDRDNTLIEDPGYISRPEQVRLLPEAAEALKALAAMGYKLIVVSNQSGVARGMLTENELALIHERLGELLITAGVKLDGIYYCPFHPEGVVEKYSRDSDLRKPNPGMLLTAAKEHDIALSQSWMIGDAYRDTTAGRRAGCKTILLTIAGQVRTPKPNDPSPDFKAVNMREAVNIIRRYGAGGVSVKPEPVLEKKEAPSVAAAVSAPAKTLVEKKDEAPAVEKPSKEKAEQAAVGPVSIDTTKLEGMFEQMISMLKTNRREEMFHDFSLSRLLAGCFLIVVVFCLLAAVYFLLSPSARNGSSVMVSLGFAIVFQLMSLTLYIMSRK